jgi:hypothetical protein
MDFSLFKFAVKTLFIGNSCLFIYFCIFNINSLKSNLKVRFKGIEFINSLLLPYLRARIALLGVFRIFLLTSLF